MAYNKQNFIKIKTEYEGKNLDAKNAAFAKSEALRAAYPDYKMIDDKLRSTCMLVLEEASKGKDGLDKRIKKIRDNNMRLQEEKKNWLISHGYPSDYTDVKYECPDCRDTGFVGTKMCHCFKKALAKAGFESSGLGKLLKDQSFETFETSYQTGDSKELAKLNLLKCRSYADSFSNSSPNLLLIGGTGLGKTHLSTSIAKVVIEKGYDVIYDTAQNIVSDFENERFKNQTGLTEKYFDCDLLIIDDLGVEMKTQFSVSAVYNLINTRINQSKCMIINTNLDQRSLLKNYDERISSRILGEFEPVFFKGDDVRLKKLGL